MFAGGAGPALSLDDLGSGIALGKELKSIERKRRVEPEIVGDLGPVLIDRDAAQVHGAHEGKLHNFPGGQRDHVEVARWIERHAAAVTECRVGEDIGGFR